MSEIRDLLYSLIDEIALDEESTDVIIHEYTTRIADLFDQTDEFFLPEDLPYIG